MRPIVIDNAVPKLLFERFQREMLSFNTEWHYLPSTAYRGNVESTDASFSHTSLFEGQKTSDLLYMYESVLLAGLSCVDINVTALVRLRTGLFMKADQNYVHPPHVDFDYPHLTALLYLNDSDGDTLLYKERYDNSHGLNASDYFHLKLMETVTVETSVSPKANRMVIFDGLQYHSSTSPVNSARRVTMNCNFIGELNG
jgi:hypothetical protein